jgi:hypothetical protein
LLRQTSEDACDNKDVYQGDFEKEKPTKPHELVPAKTGQRPAHPDKKEQERGNFAEKCEDVEETAD